MNLLSVLLFAGLSIWAHPLPISNQILVLTKSETTGFSIEIVQVAINLLDGIPTCSPEERGAEDSSKVHIDVEHDFSKIICRLAQSATSYDLHNDLVRRADPTDRLFPRGEPGFDPSSPEPAPVEPTDPEFPEDNTNNSQSDGSSGLGAGAVAGIVIGSIIGAIILGLLIWYCIRQHRGEGAGATPKKVVEI